MLLRIHMEIFDWCNLKMNFWHMAICLATIIAMLLCDRFELPEERVLTWGSMATISIAGMFVCHCASNETAPVDKTWWSGQLGNRLIGHFGGKRIFDFAHRVGEVAFSVYVIDPAQMLMGGRKAYKFLGLLEEEREHETPREWYEALIFAVVHLSGFRYVLLTDHVLSLCMCMAITFVVILPTRQHLPLKSLMHFSLVTLVSYFLVHGFRDSPVVLIVVGVLYWLEQSLYKGVVEFIRNSDEKPLEWFTGLFLSLSFITAYVILALFYVVVCFNSIAVIIVANHDDCWLAAVAKALAFYSVFCAGGGALMHCFGVLLHLSEDLSVLAKYLQSSHRDKKRNHAEHERNLKHRKAKRRFLAKMSIVAAVLYGIAVRESCLHRRHVPSPYSLSDSGLSFSMFGVSLHRNDSNHRHNIIQRNKDHSYRACSMRWEQLTALDHAILSRMAYFQAELDEDSKHELTGMKQALAFAFPKTQYNVTLDEDWKTHPMRVHDVDSDNFDKYYKFDFHNLNHTVIAVQGTDVTDYVDILADGRLWIISAVIDIFERLIPPLNFIVGRHRANAQWLIDALQTLITLDETQVSAGDSRNRF